MDSLQLKNKIIQRIIEIEDASLLVTLNHFFNTSDKNIAHLLSITKDQIEQLNSSETEDFTSYIKEWVKNM